MTVRRALWVRALLAVAVAGIGIVAACGKSPTGPSGDCGSGLTFTFLPVPFSAIAAATVIGSMNPPVHTIPADHAGFYVTGSGITLSSPAAMRVTGVKTAHYLTSPSRAGQSDYAVYGNLCNGYQLQLGHIQTLVQKIQSQTGTNCMTYSTADETIQACQNDNANVELSAGETIGTVGGATAAAFDFGLYQTGHQNVFVNPSRFTSLMLTAVCPYDPFTPDLRNQINSVMGLPGAFASGESPICGTVNVDVAGTAAGIWVLQSAPVNQGGDDTNFLALTPNPLAPQSAQAFSIGPASLASSTSTSFVRYPIAASGRVNRLFRDVQADNQIYCYTYDGSADIVSYFIRLSGSVLTLQKVTHLSGASPCNADPASWALDGSAVNFIR